MSDTPNPRPEPVEGPIDDVSAELTPPSIDAPAAAAPSLPALGDAIHVAGRSGIVFGVRQREGRVFVTLGANEDWLALA